MSALCTKGFECPETPLYVLRYRGMEDKISVNPNTGIIYEHRIGILEEQQRIRQQFDWLYDEMTWQNLRRLFQNLSRLG